MMNNGTSAANSGEDHSGNNGHGNDFTSAALLEQLVYVDTFMPEIDDPTHLDDRLTAELAAFVGDSFVFPDEEKPKLPKEEDDRNHKIPDLHKPLNGFSSNSNANSNHGNNDHHSPANNAFNNNNGSFGLSTNKNADMFLNSNLLMNPMNSLNHLNYSTSTASSTTTPDLSMNQLALAQQQLLQQQLQLQQHTQDQQHQQQHQQQQQQLPTTAAPTDILSGLPKVPVPPGAKSSLIAAGLSTTQIDALAALIAQHETSKSQSALSSLATSFATGGSNGNGNGAGAGSASRSSGLNLGQQSSLAGSSNGVGGSSSHSLYTPFSGLDFQSSSSTSTSNIGSSSTSSALAAALGDTKIHSSRSSSRSRHNSMVDMPKLPEDEESTGDPELDKRKRNTAASARFRIKKKLKEQQLERSVRELTELTMTLEKKIQTLEMENRLLRNLVVEKGEQRNNSELEMLKQRAKMASDAETHALNRSLNR